MATIQENLDLLKSTKASLKQAILDKGVVDVGDTFSTYPDKIAEIQGVVITGLKGPDLDKLGYSENLKALTYSALSSQNTAIGDATKAAYDKWNPSYTSADMSYYQDTSFQYAPAVDLSNVTSARECFWSCSNMIMAPSFNTSKCKDLTSFFSNCGKLVSFEGLDTTSATKLDGTFYSCTSLLKLPEGFSIPGTVYYVNNLFTECKSIVAIPELDCSGVTETGTQRMFSQCYALKEFGGLKGMKVNYSLRDCTQLSLESLVNAVSKLYDFTAAGETPGSGQGTLTLGSTNYNKLTEDQIAIGTNKGWTITA